MNVSCSSPALNLTLCYYAVGDREKLKKTFQRMVQIATGITDEDRYFPTVVSPTFALTVKLLVMESVRSNKKLVSPKCFQQCKLELKCGTLYQSVLAHSQALIPTDIPCSTKSHTSWDLGLGTRLLSKCTASDARCMGLGSGNKATI